MHWVADPTRQAAPRREFRPVDRTCPERPDRNRRLSNGSRGMSQQRPDLIYAFGKWQIHLGRRELLACGVPVPLGARAFAVLKILVRSANELVTKDALMDHVWPGAMVSENTLHVQVGAIRKALGLDRALLKTASGRGYR